MRVYPTSQIIEDVLFWSTHGTYHNANLPNCEIQRECQDVWCLFLNAAFLLRSIRFVPAFIQSSRNASTAGTTGPLPHTKGKIYQRVANIAVETGGLESIRTGLALVAVTYYCQHVWLHFVQTFGWAGLNLQFGRSHLICRWSAYFTKYERVDARPLRQATDYALSK